MKLTGNTIFITGGGSGIGRGLAESLHKRGNQVIIAGRRKDRLAEVASANAGVMNIDDASAAIDEKLLVTTLTTNLMGPIRMTGALIGHLKRQNNAAVINNSSVLGFVPLAMAAVYSATKAAVHSYTLSLRYKLKGTRVKVLEIAPPWVQTDLLGSNNEPRAMPLADFIEETIRVLASNAEEVLVERAKPIRNNVGPAEAAFVVEFNDMMAGESHGHAD
jgi:uncharacterized oxidoreductase